MPIVETALGILAVFAKPIADLIEAGLADNYDAEKEKQAILNFQNALYEERLRRMMQSPR